MTRVDTRLQIVGGGKMGEALLGGLLASGWSDLVGVAVVEPDAPRRAALVEARPGLVVTDRVEVGADAVIAVKPDVVPRACEALAGAGCRRALSIAAGVTIDTLQRHLGADVVVVRAMPNTPALVGAGAAAIAAGANATSDDLAWARGVLESVGLVVEVGEASLDAVTGVSGSGPAYVFLLAEALADAGVAAGLGRDVSVALANQTLLGAARLLTESDVDATRLRHDVTSPGGTTAAGVAALEAGALRAVVAAAVAAATERSRQLGGG